MSNNKDYSSWTLEALQAEAKKVKNRNITGAFIIGFLVGIMIYGLVNNGFGWVYILIPILLISAIAKNGQTLSQKLKEIKAVIETKN